MLMRINVPTANKVKDINWMYGKVVIKCRITSQLENMSVFPKYNKVTYLSLPQH